MPLNEVFEKALAAGRAANRPALSAGSVADARALVDNVEPLGGGPAVDHIRDLAIPNRHGEALRCRLYRPVAAAPALIVYFHGGGWVTGSIKGFDAFARALASRSGCAVLLVEYRLAPEARFPGPVEDAEDLMRAAHGMRSSLAGGDARLIVGGDSAGGNLAAVAALAVRGEFEIALQLLWYPVTD